MAKDTEKEDLSITENEDGSITAIDPDSKPEDIRNIRQEEGGEDEDISPENKEHPDDSDEEREAKREARRLERKQKKERRQQELKELGELRKRVEAQNSMLENLTETTSQLSEKTLQGEKYLLAQKIEQLSQLQAYAETVHAEAISNADGNKAREALKVINNANEELRGIQLRIAQLDAYGVNQVPEQAPDKRETRKEGDQVTAVLAKSWALRNPWFKPNDNDQDSLIAREVDMQLAREGNLKSSDPEYWAEFDNRLKARLPHHYGVTGTKTPALGGMSEDRRATTGNSKIVPKEYVQTLKDAGMWDNPKVRDAAIKNYFRTQAILKERQ